MHYRWDNWSMEKLSILCKAIKVEKVDSWLKLKPSESKSHAHSYEFLNWKFYFLHWRIITTSVARTSLWGFTFLHQNAYWLSPTGCSQVSETQFTYSEWNAKPIFPILPWFTIWGKGIPLNFFWLHYTSAFLPSSLSLIHRPGFF